MSGVTHLTVRGFRSIADLEHLELNALNVLIGPNGAGKSNLLDLFRMLRAMARRKLRNYVAGERIEALLFRGRKHTTEIDIECAFGATAYIASLTAAEERLFYAQERIRRSTATSDLGSGHDESNLLSPGADGAEGRHLGEAMSKWGVYHFQDTTTQSAVRNEQPVRDNIVLHSDGSNLAPFLRHLRERHQYSYHRILDTVTLALPFLDDFVYRDEPGEHVALEWLERHDDEGRVCGPRQLSDGTIRFICLATLLLQPIHMQPSTILIDEPELGLHPFAITLLGEMLAAASESRQLIVSTQSVDLLNELRPEDVVVAERKDGASVFRRLDLDQLEEWLSDHSLGELWMMNTFGGRP